MMEKLILAIIRDSDSEGVSYALTSSDFGVTSIASTGGFLRRGQTTLLVGVKEDRVAQALDIIRGKCTKPTEADPRRTILFVLKVDAYEHF